MWSFPIVRLYFVHQSAAFYSLLAVQFIIAFYQSLPLCLTGFIYICQKKLVFCLLSALPTFFCCSWILTFGGTWILLLPGKMSLDSLKKPFSNFLSYLLLGLTFSTRLLLLCLWVISSKEGQNLYIQFEQMQKHLCAWNRDETSIKTVKVQFFVSVAAAAQGFRNRRLADNIIKNEWVCVW